MHKEYKLYLFFSKLYSRRNLMQPIGYLIIVLVIIWLFTLKKMYSRTTDQVKKTPEKKIANIPVVNPEEAPVPQPAPPKQIAYNPDQPDYHPGDGDINTGVAPTESIDIPNEFAYDYEPEYKCDMGMILGDACSQESYLRQPTDVFQGLSEETAQRKVLENDNNTDNTNVKMIGMTYENMTNPNFVPTYDVEYYNESCRTGYKPTQVKNPEKTAFLFYCASDQNTTQATPYCDMGDILKDGMCVEDITRFENYM
jgi:hypothetical protein